MEKLVKEVQPPALVRMRNKPMMAFNKARESGKLTSVEVGELIAILTFLDAENSQLLEGAFSWGLTYCDVTAAKFVRSFLKTIYRAYERAVELFAKADIDATKNGIIREPKRFTDIPERIAEFKNVIKMIESGERSPPVATELLMADVPSYECVSSIADKLLKSATDAAGREGASIAKSLIEAAKEASGQRRTDTGTSESFSLGDN